jgi:hypothetical protein
MALGLGDRRAAPAVPMMAGRSGRRRSMVVMAPRRCHGASRDNVMVMAAMPDGRRGRRRLGVLMVVAPAMPDGRRSRRGLGVTMMVVAARRSRGRGRDLMVMVMMFHHGRARAASSENGGGERQGCDDGA